MREMREIKFRGRDRNEWYYGYYVKEDNNHYILEKGKEYRVIPETVGQYVGLKDRNGKEIYEGDILQYPDGTGIGVVIFQDGCYKIKIKDAECINLKLGEVVGNIYEDPELLMKGGD